MRIVRSAILVCVCVRTPHPPLSSFSFSSFYKGGVGENLFLLFLLLLYAKLLYMTRRKIGLAGTILKRRSVSRKITARELTKSRTEIFEITHRDFLNHAA